MRRSKIWMWGVAALLPLLFQTQAQAQAQVQVNMKLDQNMTGPRSKVLVLGTVHLTELPEGFDPATLAPLLDKLAAFRPDIITIEALTGEECDFAARHAPRYGMGFCRSTEVAKKSTGLEVPAAIVEAEKMLADWPAAPTAAHRRKLASLFLAANDRASAYVQWLQLPEAERKAGDGLDAPLVELLGQLAKRRDESYMIAARLAARLGLPRVVAVDNHTGDNLQIKDEAAFDRELKAAWGPAIARMKEREQKEATLKQAKDMLPLYRYVNEPAYQQMTLDANFKATLEAKAQVGYPQQWVGGWEIRNLRMVANIRETFRERPGARVLTVVGASHKPIFDAWLGQLQGVDVVDVATVLK